MSTSRRALVVAAFLALLAPTSARAQGYTIETIARENDPTPGGGIIRQQHPRVLDLGADGRVLLSVMVEVPTPEGPQLEHRILLHQAGALHAVVGQGDLAPPPIATPYLGVAHGQLGAGAAFAWLGGFSTPSSPLEQGAFARSAGTDTALLVPGQALPGAATLVEVESVFDMNAAGDVLVEATVDVGGSEKTALLLARATGVEEVAREGEPTPAGGVFGSLSLPSLPSLGEDGSVAFVGVITGAAVSHALFLRSPSGQLGVRVSPGDPLLTPRGGTVQDISGVVHSPPSDPVVFLSVLRSPPFNFSAVLAAMGSEQREIVASEDVLPGMDGEHFGGPIWFGVSGAGDVVLAASTQETNAKALFVERGEVLQLVLRTGDAVPGHPGGAFASVFEAEINDAGQLAFHAATSQDWGIFLATPVAAEIPLAPPLALGALAALLLATARRARADRR